MALKIAAADKAQINAARNEFRKAVAVNGGVEKKADEHQFMVLLSKTTWGTTPEGFKDYSALEVRAYFTDEAAAAAAVDAFGSLSEDEVGNACASIRVRHGKIFR